LENRVFGEHKSYNQQLTSYVKSAGSAEDGDLREWHCGKARQRQIQAIQRLRPCFSSVYQAQPLVDLFTADEW
jgi:hypothetical protein